MARTIAETELAVLRYCVPLLPDQLQSEAAELIDDWNAFRVHLTD